MSKTEWTGQESQLSAWIRGLFPTPQEEPTYSGPYPYRIQLLSGSTARNMRVREDYSVLVEDYAVEDLIAQVKAKVHSYLDLLDATRSQMGIGLQATILDGVEEPEKVWEEKSAAFIVYERRRVGAEAGTGSPMEMFTSPEARNIFKGPSSIFQTESASPFPAEDEAEEEYDIEDEEDEEEEPQEVEEEPAEEEGRFSRSAPTRSPRRRSPRQPPNIYGPGSTISVARGGINQRGSINDQIVMGFVDRLWADRKESNDNLLMLFGQVMIDHKKSEESLHERLKEMSKALENTKAAVAASQVEQAKAQMQADATVRIEKERVEGERARAEAAAVRSALQQLNERLSAREEMERKKDEEIRSLHERLAAAEKKKQTFKRILRDGEKEEGSGDLMETLVNTGIEKALDKFNATSEKAQQAPQQPQVNPYPPVMGGMWSGGYPPPPGTYIGPPPVAVTPQAQTAAAPASGGGNMELMARLRKANPEELAIALKLLSPDQIQGALEKLTQMDPEKAGRITGTMIQVYEDATGQDLSEILGGEQDEDSDQDDGEIEDVGKQGGEA